jgi:hypothetical protein
MKLINSRAASLGQPTSRLTLVNFCSRLRTSASTVNQESQINLQVGPVDKTCEANIRLSQRTPRRRSWWAPTGWDEASENSVGLAAYGTIFWKMPSLLSGPLGNTILPCSASSWNSHSENALWHLLVNSLNATPRSSLRWCGWSIFVYFYIFVQPYGFVQSAVTTTTAATDTTDATTATTPASLQDMGNYIEGWHQGNERVNHSEDNCYNANRRTWINSSSTYQHQRPLVQIFWYLILYSSGKPTMSEALLKNP